jgi:hypothetical protein
MSNNELIEAVRNVLAKNVWDHMVSGKDGS